MNTSSTKVNEKKDNKNEKKVHFAGEKKKTLELFRKKSQASVEKRKYINTSYITYNYNMNYSQIGLNNECNASYINYIEQEIKNAILEMKNDCLLEIRRQSYDELELFKSKQFKSELNGEKTNEDLKGEGMNDKDKDIKNNMERYSKSVTDINNIISYERKKNLKKKKKST